MFVILSEEEERECQYKIINDSTKVDLLFCQEPVEKLNFSNRLYVSRSSPQRCRSKTHQRFTWDGVYLGKVLRIAFCCKGMSNIS